MALQYTRPNPFIIILYRMLLYRMLVQVTSVLLQLLYRLYYMRIRSSFGSHPARIVKDKPKCKQLRYDMMCDKSLKGGVRQRRLWVTWILGISRKNICSGPIQNTSVHSTVQSIQTWTRPVTTGILCHIILQSQAPEM